MNNIQKPQIETAATAASLEAQGLSGVGPVHWNLGPEALIEHAIRRGEGELGQGGALVCETGQHTGRSPGDRFVVEEASSKDGIWWGKVNKPIPVASFDGLFKKIQAHLAGKEVFVQDCYSGANGAHRLKVRIVTEEAWHNLFARNMFIQPEGGFEPGFTPDFTPDFTVVQVPSLEADPEADGTASGTFILVSLEKRMVIIGGSAYAGEIKKSIFAVMNYLLPAKGVLPMHCSANMGKAGDTAVFFGLSGTGKTTLSADSARTLIGDDEHGWADDGVFNFEGGCYAKTINLTRQAEPEIYDLCHSFGAIIENVVMDPATRAFDFFDASLTENGRVSYDLSQVKNASSSGLGGHPKNIVMLTCDAFGVLPPISRLSADQAMYHFLSGYTAKVAGTERGLKEPQATFSTCFGAPFMPRHPTVYAELLGKKMAEHGSTCWLVNTGWSGGGYGVGERMSLKYTRAMLAAALDGMLDDVAFRADPHFGLEVPESCPDVPSELLDPKSTWADKAAYDAQAKDLRARFEENFKQFEDAVSAGVKEAAIKA